MWCFHLQKEDSVWRLLPKFCTTCPEVSKPASPWDSVSLFEWSLFARENVSGSRSFAEILTSSRDGVCLVYLNHNHTHKPSPVQYCEKNPSWTSLISHWNSTWQRLRRDDHVHNHVYNEIPVRQSVSDWISTTGKFLSCGCPRWNSSVWFMQKKPPDRFWRCFSFYVHRGKMTYDWLMESCSGFPRYCLVFLTQGVLLL